MTGIRAERSSAAEGRRWASRVRLAAGLVLVAAALATSRWTVASDRTGPALILGSLVLALLWLCAALCCGLGASLRTREARSWQIGAGIGLLCALAFAVGARTFVEFGWLVPQIEVLTHRAEHTSLLATWSVAVLAGIGEECFFRGTAYRWLSNRWPVVTSVLVYALAMAVNGDPALVLAALGVGAATGWARAWSGGLLAPILVHGIWTSAMLVVLPHWV